MYNRKGVSEFYTNYIHNTYVAHYISSRKVKFYQRPMLNIWVNYTYYFTLTIIKDDLNKARGP